MVVYDVKNRKLGVFSRKESNSTDHMALADRKELEPIGAYDTPGERNMIYADIVPSKQQPVDNNSTDDQKQVIYAELAAIPPPVVDADNSA